MRESRLAAARRLAELAPHEQVAVLEACQVAQDAAGRNANFPVGLALSLAMSARDSLGRLNPRQLALSG